ncbi:MAG TPA: phosphoenolpyruvate synthase [Ohtaekwangia sp.]|nr:phosphoenolpyruvate synthase [Ohtaekwangia sp.]
MSAYILNLQEIDKTKFALAGGKATSLGELCAIEGIHVPPGFCITTTAYQQIIGRSEGLHPLLEKLSTLKADDQKNIFTTSREIRRLIETVAIPEWMEEEIALCFKALGQDNAFAIRSSATAEDLPTASFAGQQDTYLNVIGKASILQHVSKCWASLFTERAVIYRLQNKIDPRKIQQAVVVQKMVFPRAAGILFTADPVTGNRKVLSIDASFGLGEATVSGMVSADNYSVHDGRIVNKKISAKKMAIHASKAGGTKPHEINPAMQNIPVLDDEQILELERIGRKIEKHFGNPQDIEWCLADDTFYIVQSRPITTLFPIPVRPAHIDRPGSDIHKNRIFLSVGHQQMMTDPMNPLGLSFWLLTTPATMHTAAGRLFVDVTPMLSSSAGKDTIVNVLGKFDPLIKDALTTLTAREDFLAQPSIEPEQNSGKGVQGPPSPDYHALHDYDPSFVAELVSNSHASLRQLEKTIDNKSGTDLLDFIVEDIQRLKKMLSNPDSMGVIMTAMNASAWLNDRINDWLGEKNVADILSQSVQNNVTSEMGLALLDVADAIRPYPGVIEFLRQVKDEFSLNALDALPGGKEVLAVILSYLDKYGMRCAGEIDITKPRWRENPAVLVPMILSHIKNFPPGASRRKFEDGRQEALKKEKDILSRLVALPDGDQKARETKRMITLVRNLTGYREYPKYLMMNHFFLYKQAILREVTRLVQAGVIHQKEDVYFLTVDELREVVRTHEPDYGIIDQRKHEYKYFERLSPPRVMTSDGEIVTGKYNTESLPAGAIPGLAVSSGVVEGRARVILKMEDADLEEGDILVTAFTDPSWTPLFVSIKALVTEVGGLMTHGAVVAREYGLPAVVAMDNATKRIKDGQRIRVNGTDGYVEILS